MNSIYKAHIVAVNEENLKKLNKPISKQYLSVRTDLEKKYEVFVTPTIIPDYYRIRNTNKIFKMYDSSVLHTTKNIANKPIGLLVYCGNFNEKQEDKKLVHQYDELTKNKEFKNAINELIESSKTLSNEYLKKPIKKERKRKI